LHDILAAIREVKSGDDARAEAALVDLPPDNPAAHNALIALTKSGQADHRWWAVRGLAASRVTRAEELIPLLEDAEPEVRAAAALGLCTHPAESAAPALIRALEDDDALTADLAGKALAALGTAAVAPLLDFLPHASPRARVSSLRALADIGDHRAIPALLAAAGEDSALAQYWARAGLERLRLDMVFMKP